MKKNEYYLKEANLLEATLHLAGPMIIGLSIGMIYSVINAFFVGKLNNIEMISAITLALPVYTFYMAIGNMFGVGGGNYITRLITKKDTNKIQNTVLFVILGSIITGVLSWFVILEINNLITLIGANIENFYYVKIHCIGLIIMSPFIILNFSLEQLVRAEGASRISLNGIIISVVMNFIFDPLLILYFHLNVFGAALALGIASASSSLYYLYYIIKKSDYLKINAKSCKFDYNVAKIVLSNGLSELFLAGYLVFASVLINQFALKYGSEVLAGFGLALRIVQIPEFVLMGLVLGMTPIIAYNYAAENYIKLKHIINYLICLITLLSVLFAVITLINIYDIIGLFNSSTTFINTTVYILQVMIFGSLFSGYTTLLINIFQACGKPKSSATIGAIQGIILLPLIIIFNFFFQLHGLIWSMTITEFITLLLAIILFKRNNIYEI